ncbi:PHP domain-containing protein [bacterium]|nr:PHP domain-containing protein [bacterium]
MTESWIDLHVHTNYSDGLKTPAEVVQMTKDAGLRGVGIADHDTVGGIPEAEAAAKELGVVIVPGVELSSQHAGRDIHILGYLMQLDHPKFVEYLKLFQDERYRRAEKMVKKLNLMGVSISMAEVEARSNSQSIGRPHIAEILTEKGYVETFQEAFYRYIGYRSEAYEEKYRITPDKAIALIAEAGGLSFLAHPSPIIDDKLILELIKAGLDGLEIVHPKLSDRRMLFLQKVAQNHGLLVSGGSDCHGGRNGMTTLGRYKVPFSIVEEMQQSIISRRGS